MRILIDEDLASRELISRLTSAFGEDVLKPELGASDEEVWRRAQSERAAVLTGNVIDFLRLAREDPGHHGLLLVYRTNNRSSDLRAADIAQAVSAIVGQWRGNVDALVLAVNDSVK